MNAQGDRLSSLSDDLIIKILSYNDTKHAIKTSILSSRWKNTWKSIPHLDLSTGDIISVTRFHDFTHLFSSRNNEIELLSIKLSVSGGFSQLFLRTIMNYAFSHNVQKITIICLDDKRTKLPPSLFISQTLKDLTLVGSARYGCQLIKIKSSWVLPALTTLHLDHVMFINENPKKSGDLFFKCPNLKNLILSNCIINDHNHYTISHPQLSNLTLKNGDYSAVNVVAPHLKSLTVVDCRGDLMISAPQLSSLMYKNTFYIRFLQDCLSSLEKVDFYIYHIYKEEGPAIIDILQKLRNVKYLTLGMEIVEVLASCVDLVSHLPSPFAKLTSLKIYPGWEEQMQARLQELEISEINVPTEIKNYLLDGSPSAIVSIYSFEEKKALQDAALAQQIMARLQWVLEEVKIECETHIDEVQLVKAPMERHVENMNEQRETQIDEGKHVKEEISVIKNCWAYLFMEIDEEKDKIDGIMSMLDEIEQLLQGLPALKKDSIQERFSSLRGEAYSVMKLIYDCMKIKCDARVSTAFMNLL